MPTVAAPSAELIIEALDHRREADVGANQIRLHEQFGLDALVPHYVEAFPRMRNWIARKYVLYYLQRYARSRPEVVVLARNALSDKSWKVRYDACGALAYALDRDAIPALEELLKHQNERTRRDAAAAIRAIVRRNHHLYVDRDETGKVFWELRPGD